MRKNGQKTGDPSPAALSGRGSSGLIPQSFRTLSRIVSSGASSAASTVRTAASTALRDAETNHDQVSWAGFDKLQLEKDVERQVLLLGFHHGFHVWDVEVASNVCKIASRHDISASFMQMQPIPCSGAESDDKFSQSRPLLIVCGTGPVNEDESTQENGSIQRSMNGRHMPTTVWFYSLKSRSYVHLLRFRSAVHLVRCSCRIVAVLQSAQIYCLNAATLETEYTILTNPVTPGCYGSGNIGLGPLAVGTRWMAYSGSLVVATNLGRVSPQHLTPSCSTPASTSNGNIVSHYAKETSKQLAVGIATLGDMGYKKLSRYYSDLLPDGKDRPSGTTIAYAHSESGHSSDADNIGMVIVRDIVQKTVIAQFQAHRSPISALCFDPSGTLLVTASVHGHNINVFRIMPGPSGDFTGPSSLPSYAHLYQLQRGITNAVIQDICFSNNNEWIMISSSRGTSHLFAVSPSGGVGSVQSSDAFSKARNNGTFTVAKPATLRPSNSGLQVLTPWSIYMSDSPITLLPVSRIRNGNNGWRNTVNVAAAVTYGRLPSFSGAIASTFHKCEGNDLRRDMKKNYYLLVFSPIGCMIQYSLQLSSSDGIRTSPGVSIAREPGESGTRLMVEAIQKWNICQKRNGKDQGDDMDMYGENGISSSSKVHPEMKYDNKVPSDSYSSTTKEKATTEEKHAMCISEAELQMHENTNPLWLRSEIYFQLLLDYCSDGDDQWGEVEIEKLLVHTLEPRSRELIPVFSPLHAPTFQQGRATVRNRNHVEQFQSNELVDVVGSTKLSLQSRSSSLDTLFDGSFDNTLDSGSSRM